MAYKVSIIVPSYNQGMFIGQTLDSILSQGYHDLEILVIDGGSSDNTVEVLKNYGEKIFWISEKDKGQTHAINKGIALAKGEIITFLNSDDMYLNGTIKSVVNSFEKNKNTLWITGDYVIVDEKGVEMQSFVAKYKTFFRNKLSFDLLSILNPINQPSTFLSRTLIDKVGLFNESLRYTMDYEYWLRSIKIQKPLVSKEKFSAFRIHSQSKGGSQYVKQFQEELEVAKKFQNNGFLIFLHWLHNFLINMVYKMIK